MRSARLPGKSPPAGLRSAGAKSAAGRRPAQAAPGAPGALAPANSKFNAPLCRGPLAASECPLATRGADARRRELAMAGARRLLYLWLGCFCVSLARGERLKQNFPELHKAVPGDRVAGGGSGPVLPPHDKVSEHMLRLYDRYRGGGKAEAERTPGSSERGSQPLRPQPLREGNTVRSFRAGAAGECPRRPVSAVQPQVSPGTPPPFFVCPPLSNATWRPSLTLCSCPRAPSVPRFARSNASFRARIEREIWREGGRATD